MVPRAGLDSEYERDETAISGRCGRGVGHDAHGCRVHAFGDGEPGR